MTRQTRKYNGPYEGDHLEHVAFPMGGIGAGMICIRGNGMLSHFSLRHKPDFVTHRNVFSALCVKGVKDNKDGKDRINENGGKNVARILEGPLPQHLVRGRRIGGSLQWMGQLSYRLPRMRECSFSAQFPFATIQLHDPEIPLEVEVTGWSPFIPGDSHNSSLPVCGLIYRFRNSSKRAVEAVYSFHAENIMANPLSRGKVVARKGGFALSQDAATEKPWEEGHFCAAIDDESVRVDTGWIEGGWNDRLMILWSRIAAGRCENRCVRSVGSGGSNGSGGSDGVEGTSGCGASLMLPFSLEPDEEKMVCVMLSWFVPDSGFQIESHSNYPEPTPDRPSYKPWYATEFKSIEAVADYWSSRHDELLDQSRRFTECFYDTNLPDEIVEAVSANLGILKSPTIFRQHDGRIWCWEGSNDSNHFCYGSCTHVWNYAQAMAHLFPDLERTLRQTEFNEGQYEDGMQTFRVPVPIRPAPPFHPGFSVEPPAAADGQLGGIIKVYRDWRICGDMEWLRGLWPKVRKSMEFCIEKWDPRHTGVPEEPQHNTYDIEFWGPNGMIATFYLGALRAAAAMAQAMGDDVALYESLYEKGRRRVEEELFNGEYFQQKIQWEGLRRPSPKDDKNKWGGSLYPGELRQLLEAEGPKYQYGDGCLSDGVIGVWMAAAAGLDGILDAEKTRSHLLSVYRHNLRRNLVGNFGTIDNQSDIGNVAGLLTCTWPKGNEPTIPVIYGYEVWPGIEYQVASHLMMIGRVAEGLDIVRCVRDRFDGRWANPFDETEHPHFYGRILSSYALLQGVTGIRYDAIEKTLHFKPQVKGDFRSFLCTASGYGTAGMRDGKPFIEVRSGRIEVKNMVVEVNA